MDIQNYKNYLLQTIKPWAKLASGGREINCRCFYCADSKNRNSGHMYIKIPQSDNDISVFYCQKCKTTGVINSKVLMEWDVYDPMIATDLTMHNKEALDNPKNRLLKGFEIYRLYNDKITDSELTRYKLKYINNRLGTNLNYDDCLNLKIVLNLNDIITRNRLKPTRDNRIVNALNDNFIGFLSHDNAFLNMRNLDLSKDLHVSIDKRYINYNLVGKFDNTCRFYNVPCTIDMSKPIQLHIAEGSFDILSIYLNLRKDVSNAVFTAIGGSGYKGILRYFISKLKVPLLEIHIYPDADIGNDIMIDIANYLKIFGYTLYIHRNMYPGEKDFGVPINKITERVERLL